MMRVLFLDFDGVLHPTSGPVCKRFELANPLAECLDGQECEVIISSSWRHSWTFPELLSLFPTKLASKVAGTTGEAHIGAYARFHEIQSWLQAQASRQKANWRALDDCGWEFPPETPELIACNPNTGLSGKELQTLLQWLRSADQDSAES